MSALWILLPSPIVGYFVVDSFRKIFSDDDQLIRKLFAVQPVTTVAALTALGSVVVWAVSEVVLRLL
ncbi:MAG: hypothetical protein AMS19_13200 [Gemmatimonas sp. SG8_23]|jgi:hypothetical protein|nr:MAG: hypothetical protein AMS19_13200 [Gemmatimonas sp. SG8_23]